MAASRSLRSSLFGVFAMADQWRVELASADNACAIIDGCDSWMHDMGTSTPRIWSNDQDAIT